MADEAFALSPIQARAALPTDADYDAIQQAFMETSRGRWFLTEYARRNRNADTRMVLGAIERLEAGLASQTAQVDAAAAKAAATQAAAIEAAVANLAAQAAARPMAPAEPLAETAPPVDLWPELAKAFTRTRIEIAQKLVRESNNEAFEAIRTGSETLKSISWALRERGFDARICDFLDVQVDRITDGCTGLMAEISVAMDAEAELLGIFDDLIAHVERLTRRDDPALDSLDVVVDAVADAMSEDDTAFAMPDQDDETVATTMPPDETPAAVVAETVPATAVIEAAADPDSGGAAAQDEIAEPVAVEAPAAIDPDAAFREIYGDDGDIEIVDTTPVEPPPATPRPAAPAPPRQTEPEINKQRLHEAKLQPYRISEARFHFVTPVDDIEIVDVAGVELPSAPEQPLAATPVPVELAQEPAAPAEAKPSLGQALLDSGVVPAARPRPDPLAPFCRMSQAEKIAFFT